MNPSAGVQPGKVGLQMQKKFVFLSPAGMGKIRHIEPETFCNKTGIVEFTIDQKSILGLFCFNDVTVWEVDHFFLAFSRSFLWGSIRKVFP